MLAICTSRSRSSGVGGESRIQQNIREQIKAGGEIAAQHFRVHAEAVVAAVAVQCCRRRIRFPSRFFPRYGVLRAFEQHLGEQLRDAVVRRRFRPARRLGTPREIPRTAGDDFPSRAGAGRWAVQISGSANQRWFQPPRMVFGVGAVRATARRACGFPP